MAREEKRVSIDFTACPLPLNEKDEQKLGYNSGPLKHVHFNQRKSAKSMNATKRCAGNIIPQELNQTNVTVHEITAKLKKSFQKTENNLGVLKKVCRDLVATKRILGGCTCTSKCKKREHVMELERLLSEAEAVRCTLENKASRKKLYLEELARLQQTINNDRKQMEKWTLNAGESKRVLETKLDKSVKASRDQQILIRKLKSDNEALWKILHEVQDHLKKETHNDFTNIDTNFVELEQKCLPKVPIQTNEIKSPPKGIYDARYERDNGSILSSGSSDPTYKIPSDTSSSLSSHEQVISERFKKIVEQSETIKELISNFGCPSEQYEDKKPSRSMQNRNECHWSASGNSKNEHRIPSENEKGVRCDMNDIIKRCEELEKKVEDCSANDIRQRVMQQLNEIDNGSTTSTMDKCEYIKDQWMCTECRSEQSWKPEEHKRVREELLRCLDRITSMERNFSDARREIQILRKYIKNSAEEKEFTEKTYKREAMELRLVVDDKTKDINALKESLKEALDELQKSEYLLSKIESLENAVAQKDEDLKFVKESQSSIINQLKSSLATKTLESETIKSELDAAKQSIEKLHMLEKSKKENEKANENINTELSMLQNAILEAERQMRILQEENMLLRHNESISEKLSEKVELENQSLLNRLKISEEGFCFLKNRLDSIQSEVKYTAFHDQDISTKECSPRSEVENFGHSQLGDQNKRVNSRSREQDLIKTLLKDNHKLVEKVQEKGKTIENLKESLNSLAAEVEKQIASENVKSELEAKEKVKCQQELSEELSTIKKSLDSSHRELTSRVVGLSSELENLHEENRSLREQLNKSELNEKGRFMDACKQVETLKSENDLLNNENFDLNNENARLNDKNYHLTNENAHLLNENARLNDENARLSDENSRSKISLSSPASSSSPHSKDFDELLKENKYLRFAFSHEKLELIDSNLRKKERIKGMKKELENLRNKLHSHCDGSESQYSPKSNSSSLISECQLKNQKLKDACETILVRKKSDSSNGTSDFELELSKKNELISELEEDNKKLRSKFDLYKLDADKSDMEELQVQNMEANSVLEGELRALRNVVKELGSQSNVASNETEAPIEGKESEENIDDHSTISLEEDFSSQESGRTIIETEKHDSLVESLRRKLKKCHSDMEKYKKGEIIQESTANLYKEKLKSLKEKIKISNEENVNLIGALECAKIENIELQEAYDELEKSRKEERCSVVAQNLMKEKLKDCKDKNKILNNENSALKEKMEEAKLEASARRERLSKLQLELELATSLKEEAMEEVKELKEALRSKEEEKVDEEELSEIVQVLNESLNEMHFESQKLISQLSETETEKKYLENEIKVSKVKTSCVEDKLREEFEEKMSELEERVRNESGKCEKMREENKELKKVKSALEEELETIQYDMHSNNVKAISERDANARESLASIDITIDDFKSDGEEKSSLGKHAKIFRRLQKENQNLRVKILQLEDGAIEMTRIVGNIERGHGHLTGTLRTHLIIQNESSEKILESSLHQYSSDFDKLEKEFERTEKKCDENKEYSNHRDYARELFTNAAGTILNIRTILSDGLAKVDSDLDKDLDREEFKNKDYKSKLWILKRRLSNVENRHGELQLKAEELNLRLNAKTAEFAVTQDELEEATRDLESREKSLEELQKEMVKMSVNNEKLEKIVRGLTERQGEYLENVLEANEIPQRAMIDIDQDQKEKMRNGGRADTAEKETHLKNVRLLKDEFSKENEALHRRINYLEKKLSQLTAERESLKKELETRGRYTALPGEGYGTIHMLRDNLKELTKENAKLKESLHSKQRLMYDMSKDLHQLRMEAALDLSGKKKNIFSKEKFERDMIKDLAEVKSRNEVLEAQLKDAEREKEKVPGDHKKLFSESQYKPGEKELESETLKREIYGLKRSARVASKDILTSEQVPSSDSLEDSSEHHSILQGEVTHLTEQIDLLQDLVKKYNLGDEYELLGRLKEDYEVIISQQKAEIEQQKVDIDKKRNRIKELISIVEDFKSDSKSPASNEESERRVEEIKYHEIQTLTDCLEEKRMQLEAWRKKAEAYQTELQLLRLQATHLFHDSFGNTGRNYSFHIEDSSSSQSHSKSITDYELQSPRTLQKTSGVSEHDVTYTVGDNQSDDEEEAEINDGEQSSEIDDEVEDANEREEDSLIFSPTNSTRTSRIPIRASDNVVSGAASRESDDEPLNCVPSSFKAVGHSNGNLALNDSQVNEFEIIIKTLNDERTIYRTKLDPTDYGNLETLGLEQLENVLNYNTDARHFTKSEKLQREIKKLIKELVRAKEELYLMNNYHIKAESDSSNNAAVEAEITALRQKCLLKFNESETLKELLDTQAQNVSTQSYVIETLKSDLASGQERFHKESHNLLSDIKKKKRTIEKLKQKMKSYHDSMLAERKRGRKRNRKIRNKFTQKIQKWRKSMEDKNMVIEDLRKDFEKVVINMREKETEFGVLQCKFDDIKYEVKSRAANEIADLKNKLLSKQIECDEALRRAEDAFNAAKERKIEEGEIEKLKEEVRSLMNNAKKDMECKNEMTKALEEKNSILNDLQNEYSSYKEMTAREIEFFRLKIIEMENESPDKIRASSKFSELHFENNGSTLPNGALQPQRFSEEVKNKPVNKDKAIENLQGNESASERSTSFFTCGSGDVLSQINAKDDDWCERKIDMDIEVEILRGCNEELEEEVKNLSLKLKDSEEGAKATLQNMQESTRNLEKAMKFTNGRERDYESLCLENKRLQEMIDECRKDRYDDHVAFTDTPTNKRSSSVGSFRRDHGRAKRSRQFAADASVDISLEEDDEDLAAREVRSSDSWPNGWQWYIDEENILCQSEEQLRREVENLRHRLKIRNNKVSKLEATIEYWMQISKEQKHLLGKLNSQVKLYEQKEGKAVGGGSSQLVRNEIELLKLDNSNKASLIATLQDELTDKVELYNKTVLHLRKRRDELREMMDAQEKLQSQLCRKENVIYVLKDKLESNNIDFSDAEEVEISRYDANSMLMKLDDIELWTSEEKEKLIHDQRHSIFNIVDILSITRERVTKLKKKLENEQEKYCKMRNEKGLAEQVVSSLSLDVNELTDKLEEVRTFVHGSKPEDVPNEEKAIPLRTKLYCAYKELREKSSEIGRLQLSMHLKDTKIHQLEAHIDTMRVCNNEQSNVVQIDDDDSKYANISRKTENKKGENTSANASKLGLKQRKKQIGCDCYQKEDIYLRMKLRELEHTLIAEDRELREKYLINAENINGHDSYQVDDTFSTYLVETSPMVDLTHTNESIESNVSQTQILINREIQTDGDVESRYPEGNVWFYQFEVEELKTEIERVLAERDELKNMLLEKENELKMKVEVIEQLKCQLKYETKQRNDAINEHQVTKLQAEQEKCLLKHKLDIQEKRYEVETEYIKSICSCIKHEHVTSLKKDLHRTCREKIEFELHAQDMEDTICENEAKIANLLEENASLLEAVKEKEKKVENLSNGFNRIEENKNHSKS